MIHPQTTDKPANREPEWDFMLKSLKDNKCIFVLGPGFARNQAGVRFHDAFIEHLNIHENPLVASYYEREELFLFPDAIKKTLFADQMHRFYQAEQADVNLSPYQKLAALPVKLIINASPDNFLSTLLGPANCRTAIFHKANPNTEIPPPAPAKPLIYNLVGHIDQEESLLLTHDDLYQFIEAVLAGQNLPKRLLDELFAAKCLIFLGLSFQKWYVQLLLRLLKIDDANHGFVRYATQDKFNAETLSICTDQFKIEFVEDYDIDAFLGELHDRCAEKGLLVDRMEAETSEQAAADLTQQVKQLIAQDRLEEAAALLQETFEQQQRFELADAVISLKGRLSRLERRKRAGLLSEEAYQLDRNTLAEALIQLANEL